MSFVQAFEANKLYILSLTPLSFTFYRALTSRKRRWLKRTILQLDKADFGFWELFSSFFIFSFFLSSFLFFSVVNSLNSFFRTCQAKFSLICRSSCCRLLRDRSDSVCVCVIFWYFCLAHQINENFNVCEKDFCALYSLMILSSIQHCRHKRPLIYIGVCVLNGPSLIFLHTRRRDQFNCSK